MLWDDLGWEKLSSFKPLPHFDCLTHICNLPCSAPRDGKIRWPLYPLLPVHRSLFDEACFKFKAVLAKLFLISLSCIRGHKHTCHSKHRACHEVTTMLSTYINLLQHPYDISSVVISILQMRKLSHREVRWLAQGHTAEEVPELNLKPSTRLPVAFRGL